MNDTPPPPPASDRYKVLEALGEGGQGKVYKAFDLQLQRFVALKRLLKNKDSSQEQLRKEALTLAGLHHPNIVAIHDVATDDQGLFLVMELVEGEDLSRWLEGEALSMEDFHQLASQSLEAMMAAHEIKVLHRDIKPENLRVSRLPGGRLTVKMLDFGLARASQNARRQTADQGTVKGSIRYMAPEQLEHKPMDGRTDLYALGCVFYKVLTGRTAFNAETVAATIDAHLEHRVIPLQERAPAVPDDLAQWVMWLMNRRPDDRPESARAALASLTTVFEDIKAGQLLSRAIESGTVTHSSNTPVTLAHPLATQSAPVTVALPGTNDASGSSPAAKKKSMLPIAAGALLLAVGGGAFVMFGGKKDSATKPAAAAAPSAPATTPATAAPVASATADTTAADKTERTIPDYPPVQPTAFASRPALPLEMRLVSRYIASDHLLRYGDLDNLKKKNDEVPAGPGLAVSTWNDLVAVGGNRPFLVRDRSLQHSPRMELIKDSGLRGEIPVVAFNEGHFLRAVLPLDAADKVHLDPSTSGGNKPGHTLVMVVRPRSTANKRDNRLLTVRRMSTDQTKRTSYQLIHTRDQHLRLLTSIEGTEQPVATTTDLVPADKLYIVTMLISQNDKTTRLFVRGPGGFNTTSTACALNLDVPAMDEIFIGTKPGGARVQSTDCIADIAELIVYRSALTVDMASKIESDLAAHYFDP